MIEKRYFKIDTCEVREKTDAKAETVNFGGRAILYDHETELWDGFYEKINTDAFKDAVETDDVRCLFNHDPNIVLGRNKSGTLLLVNSDSGVDFTVEAPASDRFKELAESVKRGDINQCSFAFSVESETWSYDDNGDVHRSINLGKLYDVSIVTYPAYEDTEAYCRSKKQELTEKRKKENKGADEALILLDEFFKKEEGRK